jgi:predicted Zn-dependent protease
MQGKPSAVALAERAVKLAPNQGALLDTLALAHARAGALPRALEIQKQVVAMSPDRPTFRLSLARLQVQAGDRNAARENLNRLIKLGEAFEGHAEVTQLLRQTGT